MTSSVCVPATPAAGSTHWHATAALSQQPLPEKAAAPQQTCKTRGRPARRRHIKASTQKRKGLHQPRTCARPKDRSRAQRRACSRCISWPKAQLQARKSHMNVTCVSPGAERAVAATLRTGARSPQKCMHHMHVVSACRERRCACSMEHSLPDRLAHIYSANP